MEKLGEKCHFKFWFYLVFGRNISNCPVNCPAPQFILFVFVTCWYGNISSLIKLSIALLFLSGL